MNYQTFYFSHFYAVADSDDNHESIRLGLLFQEEGDMRLVDEGYITLTYNDPIPEAGFLDILLLVFEGRTG